MHDPSPSTAAEALGVTATPPPARLSGRTVLDEATRPRAPRGSERAWTDYQRMSAQHLVDVHDHLRAELETVRGLVTQVLDAPRAPARRAPRSTC